MATTISALAVVAVIAGLITWLVLWCRHMDREDREYRQRLAEADDRYIARSVALAVESGRPEFLQQAYANVNAARRDRGH